MNKTFQLEVIKLDQLCNFKLSWGEGQTLSAQLPYPQELDNSYQEWQKVYLDCYQNLRAKAKITSLKAPPKDWQGRLREAEARLISEFHSWLRRKELYEIHEEIRTALGEANAGSYWVDILLTCNSHQLARLPWEAWEINSNLSAPGRIRLARVPGNILHPTIQFLSRKARVLAIMGDEQGLDFKEDKQALGHFSQVAEVEFEGWQPGRDIPQLKEEIAKKIAQGGWDILFFAGHSNETALTGGNLSIAPGASMAIADLEEPLKQALNQGLQFAIFNSCEGISIAESLINLGVPQVAVMREPIHNKVAQEFLVQFLTSLAEYKDVHEALLDGCAFLKEKKNLTYPSAYLIPSLFRHPQSELFRLEPFGLWQSLKNWLPTKREVLWLLVFILLSLTPLKDLLLESRLLLQSAYRNTFESPRLPVSLSPRLSSRGGSPPILLVQIDQKSLNADNVQFVNERYLNYSYLAQLLDELVKRKARVIGVDYILDKDKQQPNNSNKLKQSVEAAIEENTWLVWGAIEETDEGVSPQIANLQQTMEGDITTYDWHIELPQNNCADTCPFSYLLALTYLNQGTLPANLLQQQSQANLRTSVIKLSNFQFPISKTKLSLLFLEDISKQELMKLEKIMHFPLCP